jgi:hypothetical protein
LTEIGELDKMTAEDPEDSLPLSSLDPSLASTLNSLCLEYRRLGSEIDQREITRKSLKEEIETLVLALPAKRISSPDWKTVKSQKITHPLQRPLLIAECNKRDIDPLTVVEIIKVASPEKKGKEYVSILAPGKEGETHKESKSSSGIFD